MAVDWTTDHLTGTNEQRTLEIVSSATPAVNVDIYGAVNISALAAAITVVTFTGTPNDLQVLRLRIKDNGVARALAFGAQFEAVGVALPTITVAGKRHTLTFLFDSVTAKFGLVAAVVEA